VILQYRYVGALGQGGSNAGRVAHILRGGQVAASLQEDASRRGTAWQGITGHRSRPLPLPGGMRSWEDSLPGRRKESVQEKLLARAGRKEQSRERGFIPLSHQRSVRGMNSLRWETRVPPREHAW
jgi:hypothetical protein